MIDGSHRRIVYVVNHVAFFVSHRLPLAVAAQSRGWDVVLITGQAGSPTMEAAAEEALAQSGIRHIRTRFQSVGFNPLKEVHGLVQLMLAVRRLRPEIVHTASPKGTLYGGLAARIAGTPALVIAVSGMGYLFTGGARGIKAMLRWGYSRVQRWVYAHPKKRVIVQNQDDHASLISAGLAAAADITLIPGSGVRLDDYAGLPSKGEPIVVLPARMLRDKGVIEYVEAARILRSRGHPWRFVLAGAADYANPTAIARPLIQSWVAEGVVEWWGHRDDMAAVFGQAEIVCLPSYREGMPKCLLEAAAAGRAVVTTDVTGCREAIRSGETGDLVPPADAQALAAALEALMVDPARRKRYGAAGRLLARERFGLGAVVDRTMTIYEELVADERN